MRLLYTNANEFLGEQTVGDKSIGGIISGTEVPNGFFGNFFGDLSMNTIQSGLRECKCVSLHNNTQAIKENIKLTIIPVPEQMFDIEVAIVTPNTNPRGGLQFEKLSDMRATPVYANFYRTYSSYDTGILQIQSAPELGEVISLYENNELLLQITSSKTTAEGLASQILSQVVEGYELKLVSSTEILFRRRVIGHTNTTISLDTEGTAYAPSVELLGGSDNSLSLPSLAVNGYYGIWMKRTIKEEFVGGFSDENYIPLQRKTLTPRLLITWD